jgi:hypothetical protein
MGYDSTIYVIRKTDVRDLELSRDNRPLCYAETMAIYKMCVFPPFQMLFNKDCPVTDYYPVEGDNNIIEDKYGEPLRERSLAEVIDCLDQYIVLNQDDEIYARVKPLMALLQEYEKIQNNYYRLAVLHYGR